MHHRTDEPNDAWYDDGPRFGPGIVIRRENFGPAPAEAEPDDVFARRQDAIQHLNTAVAEADAIAAQALQDQRARFFDEGGSTDFAARQRELLKGLRKEALKNASDSSARDGLGAVFDRLSERHLRRAVVAEHEARVRARAQGAERALERFKAAALVDPDGFADRIAEADALLSRLVEAGTDPLAAAERAHSFRLEMGQAVLDDLAERDPAGALARLDSGAFNDAFDEEGRAGARNALLRVIEADREATEQKAELIETDAERERAARRRATVAALRAGLRDGSMNLGHIARAQYRGEIDGPDALGLRIEAAGFRVERARREAAIDAFDAATKAEGFAPMPRETTRSDIDIWTKRELERGRLLPEMIAKVIRILGGGVPEPYVDDVRRRLLSASPEDSVSVGRELRALRRDSPETAEAVLASLPSREARDLALYADYAHLELPPERIGELVGEEQDQQDAIETKEIKPGDLDRRIEPQPMVHRPGYVWENGQWRPMTDQERGDAVQLKAEQQLDDDLASGNSVLENHHEGENEEAESEVGSGNSPGPDELPPPTDEPVDPEQFYRVLDYDPHGPNEIQNFFEKVPFQKQYPFAALRSEALNRAHKVQELHGLDDGEKDAFRHAYWSYKLAEMLGPEAAKSVGDAHERRPIRVMESGKSDPEDEILMDLYNNHVGRQLFNTSKSSRARNAEQIVLDALRSGKLQVRPFALKK